MSSSLRTRPAPASPVPGAYVPGTHVAAGLLADAPVLHRAGQLEVRLATAAEEIRAAQALRYDIFYNEMGARPTPAAMQLGRDVDAYDALCDHLLVLEHGVDGAAHVVGTYRLLREVVARRHSGFYSSGEYDLAPLLGPAGRALIGPGRQLLELGRSCVAPAFRTSATITLLWRGIASYLRAHKVGMMFGCASLPGTNPDVHAAALSYLAHHHGLDAPLRIRALPQHFIAMDRLPAGSYDPKEALRSLPPLIKGYLRAGCSIGDGAFVDHQFNTVDVFILMPVERITARYLDRYQGSEANNVN